MEKFFKKYQKFSMHLKTIAEVSDEGDYEPYDDEIEIQLQKLLRRKKILKMRYLRQTKPELVFFDSGDFFKKKDLERKKRKQEGTLL